MTDRDDCHVAKVDALVHPGQALDVSLNFGIPNVLVRLDSGINRDVINVCCSFGRPQEQGRLKTSSLGGNHELMTCPIHPNNDYIDPDTGLIPHGDG
jgi:hypothetical protein